jgi:hypothetical protein
LLARRDEVRAKQSAEAPARPELFIPAKKVELKEKEAAASEPKPDSGPESLATEQPKTEESAVTNRLLEAKRRARKNLE